MSQDATTIHEGWMRKLGEGVIKTWKRRWFILRDNGKMSYFVDQSATQRKGTADLSELTTVERTPNKNGPFELRARTPDRTWVLQTATEDECTAWIAALNKFSLTERLKMAQQANSGRSGGGGGGGNGAEAQKLREKLNEQESAAAAFKREIEALKKSQEGDPSAAQAAAQAEVARLKADWEDEKRKLVNEHEQEKQKLATDMNDQGTNEVKEKLSKMKNEMAAQKDLLIEAATSVQTLEEAMDKQEQKFREELSKKEAEMMRQIATKQEEAEVEKKKAREEGFEEGKEQAEEEFSVTQAKDYDPQDVMRNLAAATNIKVLEGNLTKFGKAGKTVSGDKFVRFVYTGAEGLLFWSDSRNDPKPNLLKVKDVSKDHQLVQRKLTEDEKDRFWLALVTDQAGKDKRLVFLAKDANKCAYWFDGIKAAIDPTHSNATEV